MSRNVKFLNTNTKLDNDESCTSNEVLIHFSNEIVSNESEHQAVQQNHNPIAEEEDFEEYETASEHEPDVLSSVES